MPAQFRLLFDVHCDDISFVDQERYGEEMGCGSEGGGSRQGG